MVLVPDGIGDGPLPVLQSGEYPTYLHELKKATHVLGEVLLDSVPDLAVALLVAHVNWRQ